MGKQSVMLMDAALNEIEDDSTPLLPDGYWNDEDESAENIADRIAYKIGYLKDISEHPVQFRAKLIHENNPYERLEKRSREDLINLGKSALEGWAKDAVKGSSSIALSVTNIPVISKTPNVISSIDYADKALSIMHIANNTKNNNELKITVLNCSYFYLAKISNELAQVTVGVGQDVATSVTAAFMPVLIVPGMFVNIATGITAKKVAKESIKKILSLSRDFNKEKTIKHLIDSAINGSDETKKIARDVLKIFKISDKDLDVIDENDDASRNKVNDKLRRVFKW